MMITLFWVCFALFGSDFVDILKCFLKATTTKTVGKKNHKILWRNTNCNPCHHVHRISGQKHDNNTGSVCRNPTKRTTLKLNNLLISHTSFLLSWCVLFTNFSTQQGWHPFSWKQQPAAQTVVTGRFELFFQVRLNKIWMTNQCNLDKGTFLLVSWTQHCKL